MVRKERSIHENLLTHLHEIHSEKIRDFRIREAEEHIRHLHKRMEYFSNLARLATAEQSNTLWNEISQPFDIDKNDIKQMHNTLHSLFANFVEGFRLGIRGLIKEKISKFLTDVFLKAYTLIKAKSAWVWKGYLMYAYYDKLYITFTDKYEDILKAIVATCEYADRFVKLIEGLEGYSKSFAHEYLSHLRRLRCHLSQVSIRVTPLTMKVLENKEGNIYCAMHIDARTLTYSPYSRRIYPLPPHFEIILRRKPDVKFSSRIDSGYIVLKPDSDVVSARDFADRPYAVRKLISLAVEPRILIKDRARSLGMPEQAYNIDTCSIYFIPRPTKSKRFGNVTDPKIRALGKPNIYIRMPRI